MFKKSAPKVYPESLDCARDKLCRRGFTLVELLVVITIIAVLSTVGLVVYSTVSKSGRMAKRIQDLKAIQTALELYYSVNKSYPNPGGAWRGECLHPWGTGGLSSDQVIPGLVPTYMPAFPADPQMSGISTNGHNCYLYTSNGTDYKVMDVYVDEFSQADYRSQINLVDPRRDGDAAPAPANYCTVSEAGTVSAWAVWSSCKYDPSAPAPCTGSCTW